MVSWIEVPGSTLGAAVSRGGRPRLPRALRHARGPLGGPLVLGDLAYVWAEVSIDQFWSVEIISLYSEKI